MSTKVMSRCWDLSMPPAKKAVLISLADQANDDGLCWPSAGTIARRTCLSERAVRFALSWLALNRYIRVEARSGRSNHFYLTPERGATPARGAAPPLNEVHPTPAPRSPRTVREPTGETSLQRGITGKRGEAL